MLLNDIIRCPLNHGVLKLEVIAAIFVEGLVGTEGIKTGRGASTHVKKCLMRFLKDNKL